MIIYKIFPIEKHVINNLAFTVVAGLLILKGHIQLTENTNLAIQDQNAFSLLF